MHIISQLQLFTLSFASTSYVVDRLHDDVVSDCESELLHAAVATSGVATALGLDDPPLTTALGQLPRQIGLGTILSLPLLG